MTPLDLLLAVQAARRNADQTGHATSLAAKVAANLIVTEAVRETLSYPREALCASSRWTDR